jgi:SAM-dependent methyltransferase
MNRKARRANRKQSALAPQATSAEDDRALTTTDLMEQANWHHRRGQLQNAQDICDKILVREPSHVNALNLSGLILQATGRHRPAARLFAKALACDPWNAACHYNLGVSFQALDRQDEATVHFRKAIELGARLKNIEDLILQNPVITSCVDAIESKWPLPITAAELFARYSLETIANDILLRCALATVPLHHAPLEKLLTALRAILLRTATTDRGLGNTAVDRLFCALAQQCFINEYVFAQSDEETRQSHRLRELLLQKITDGLAISALLLAAVAAYFPLYSLPGAQTLLRGKLPEATAALVRQQLQEPLQEIEDRKSIPVLTPVDDDISLRVMDQYRENPYPRWTVNPVATPADDRKDRAQSAGPRETKEILVAGCGSGQHAVETAQHYPEAQILAVDLSLSSLAYARRKTHEIGLRNVEYAQADILALAALHRSFDRIEAVGVLHHLADPELGWRILLALLRPKGTMRIGLYSELARRDIVGVRSFIAERGYRATPDDIRILRQEVLRIYDERGWRMTVQSNDFYNTSGCRDLLFNVMEHRFTIPKIKRFVSEQDSTFLGFDLDPSIVERFERRFPGAGALADLDSWHSFEMDNPPTFRSMYQFTIEKN